MRDLPASLLEEGHPNGYFCLCEDEYFGDKCELMSLAKSEYDFNAVDAIFLQGFYCSKFF